MPLEWQTIFLERKDLMNNQIYQVLDDVSHPGC